MNVFHTVFTSHDINSKKDGTASLVSIIYLVYILHSSTYILHFTMITVIEVLVIGKLHMENSM